MKTNNSKVVQHLARLYSHPFKYLLLLILLSGFVGACNRSQPASEQGQAVIREVRPTFTPTIETQPLAAATEIVNTPAPELAQAQSNEQAADVAKAPENSTGTENNTNPILVITEELVNARTGPGLNFDLVNTVERGQQFDIVGKTSDAGWWKICCVDNQQAWVIATFAETDGDVDGVVVVNDIAGQGTGEGGAPPIAATVASIATPAPVVVNNPTATPPPAPTNTPPVDPAPAALGFELVLKEQFPETNVMRVFLFVFEGNNALAGYTLRVTHNGVELPNSAAASIGPQPGLTWPIADSRQRLQNYKAEFPGEQPGGSWEVQLMLDGQPVGPPATFNLADNDRNGELYVRYQKK